MSATATEMLFAIGAGPQVVAVDNQSNFPASAPVTDLSASQPSAEAIAKYRPDLVVISDDTKNLKAQLTGLSIRVVVSPAAETIDDAYRALSELGGETGHSREAATVVAGMRERIKALVASVKPRAKPLTYFHELDNTLYTATSRTFIGQLYSQAGLRNIADTADKSGGGYPQLSAEYLVAADPDMVFLADTKCCAQDAKTFARRPGFDRLKAVRENRVVLLDDDIASRWGPRIVDLLQLIIAAVNAVTR